jgi:hypothetical protein
MNFGTKIGSVDTTSKRYPDCRGYEVVIVRAEALQTKAGDPMIRLDFDIADGEFAGFWSDHPQRWYQSFKPDDEKNFGLKILKKSIEAIVAENKGIFPEDDVFATGDFDEQRLVGCVTGVVMKWDGKYLAVDYICNKDYALSVEAKPKPAEKEVTMDTGEKTNAEKGSLFKR